MSGDITRDTFDASRRYTSVRQQQGRVQIDADWNEQVDVVTHLRRTVTWDVVGPTGAPKGGGGFEVRPSPTGDDLTISAGHIYVDGVLCVGATGQTYESQDDLPDLAPLATFAPGRYLAYLDVWELDVTALQDPSLAEPALGGPDTTTRRRTVAQVRLLDVAAGATCEDFGPSWAPPGAAPGTLRAASLTGFRRLENQLYRVVVHAGSESGNPTFKFSRDNASVRFAVESVSGRTVTLRDLGPDEARGIKEGSWVEILDDEALLKGGTGQLAEVATVDASSREVVLGGTDPVPAISAAAAQENHALVQRWDHVESDVPFVDGALPIDTTTDITLEDGVTVRFSGGSFRPGDFWLIPARAAGGAVLWPTDASDAPVDLAPHGIVHRYAPLALVDHDGTAWSHVGDCRPSFPAITAIEATDVSYDPSNCALITATTVQEALDQLCGQIRNGCTLTITPDADVEAVIAAFDASEVRDARICFQDGEYTTSKVLEISDKGHLVVEGFGDGTRLRGLQLETFLSFESCESVVVRDVRVESGRASRALEGLAGALTFADCASVAVESVGVVTAHGTERASAGISVTNPRRGHNRVRLENCHISVGHQQAGIVVTDGRTIQVSNNEIRARPLPGHWTLRTMLDNKAYRAAVRNAFLTTLEPTADTGPMSTVRVTSGGHTASFLSPGSLSGVWQPFVEAEGITATTSGELVSEINASIERALLDEGVVPGFGSIRDRYLALQNQNIGMMSQGIVIGGRVADDVWIVDNRIEGAGQCIHVGVSHSEARRGTPDMAGTVTIRGNSLEVTVTPIVLRRPEGIFIGNTDSQVVDGNHVVVTRTADAGHITMDGITCHGHFGARLLVRDNHIRQATIGIRVVPLNGRAPRRWLVLDNLAEGAKTAVSAPTSVDVFGNMPGGITYRDLENLARA